MSNRTDDEEMARRMRPGLRVIRGKNWIFGGIDGNGPGTVIREHPKFKHWWQVKWDRTGKTDYHQMGTTKPSVEKIYRLKIINFPTTAPQKTITLGKKLFMAKSTCDMKIICEGKTFDCHKCVLCCQSDVFEAMFSNIETIEAKSGEVEINDIQADTMETLLYFLYNEEVKETKLINAKLLCAADKYNLIGLMGVCTEYLKKNLCFENAVDVLVAAHLTNQKNLFDTTSTFVKKNEGNLKKTSAWKEFKKTNPTMATDILSSILKL